MNRIERLFEQKSKDILSVYFTAGYPQLDDTARVLRELQAQGTDLVEVGIPFSDPMADGTVIQSTSHVALNNGMTLRLLFEQIEAVRPEITMPLVMMGYLNPIMRFGVEEFCRRCCETGIDGVIIPDLPFDEYMTVYRPLAEKYGLDFIMLITPETSQERIRMIDQHTQGFIYMVSTAATTGAQDRFSEATLDYFRRINAMGLRHPRLVGFGVSNPQTFRAACDHSNGAIIGSRFVKALGTAPSVKAAVTELIEVLGVKGNE